MNNELKYKKKETLQVARLWVVHQIESVYDASGVKRTVIRRESGQNMNFAPYESNPAVNPNVFILQTQTDYVGNKIYENGVLKRILAGGGYVDVSGATYTHHYYLKDHLGSVRVAIDGSGAVKQITNYYPSGTIMADLPRRTDQGVQPYEFGSKELDRSYGLDFHDFEWRQLDNPLMRFTAPDRLREKYYGVSPFVYCGNNPVNRVDPTGMDWYWTNYDDEIKRTLQYDPKITKDSKFADGQKYAGVTVKHGTGTYRADGSIMFSNETDAYNRMWSQAKKENREQFAVIGDKNVLVTPEYKNTNTESTPENYGYSWKDGNIKDADGNIYNTIATIHTHQDDLNGEWGFVAAPGFHDQKYFPYKTPDKPYFTMGYNGKIYGEIGNDKGRQNLSNIIPKGYNTIDDLLKGAKFQLLIKSLK